MTAVSPTYGKTHDCADREADDGAAQTDWLAGVGCPPETIDDDDTTTSVGKQGKSPDDILRVEFPGKDDIAAGDTVTVWTGMAHNYSTMALLPYNAAGGVDETKIISAAVVAETIFTLNAGFIAALFDQGSGTWAARICEDSFTIDGDLEIREVDSNLTVAAGGLPIPVAMNSYRQHHQSVV